MATEPSIAESTVPTETNPEDTVPVETTPAGANFTEITPAVPNTTAPQNVLQETMVPTEPETTVPQETVPVTTIPAETVPTTTETMPQTEDSTVTQSQQNVPQFFSMRKAADTVTIAQKFEYGLPWRISFNYYYFDESGMHSAGDYFTEGIMWFLLSDGTYGFCVEPSQQASEMIITEATYNRHIDDEARVALARAIAYGSPNNGDTSQEGFIATALVIWDISTGYLNSVGGQRAGAVPPFSVAAAGYGGAIKQKYDAIIEGMAKHNKFPSFAYDEKAKAEKNPITLAYDAATNSFTASRTDANGVLSDYNFTSSVDGLTLSRDGNTLNISMDGHKAENLINGTISSASGRYYPVSASDIVVYGDGFAGTQDIVRMPYSVDPVPAYIDLSLGFSVTVTKQTTDGTTSNGGFALKFYNSNRNGKVVYLRSEGSGKFYRTTLVTDANGNEVYAVVDAADRVYAIENVVDGNFSFREELERSSSGIPSDMKMQEIRIRIYDAQDKQVGDDIVYSGADIFVENTREYVVSNKTLSNLPINGHMDIIIKNGVQRPVAVTKTSPDGKVSGIEFEIKNNTTGVSFTQKTDANGKFTFDAWVNESYTIKEIVPDGYICTSQNPQTITVNADATKNTVKFENIPYVTVTVVKTSDDGVVDGITFTVKNNTTGVAFTDTTKNGGKFTFNALTGESYTITETVPANYTAAKQSQTITISADTSKNVVTFVNTRDKGEVKIIKTTSDGRNLLGWEFYICSDSSCKNVVRGPLYTDKDGVIYTSDLKNLPTGDYWVKETGKNNDKSIAALYTFSGTNPQKITVNKGETATVTFDNVRKTVSAEVIKLSNDGIVANIVFSVTNTNTGSSFEEKTNDEGKFTFTANVGDTYTITEIVPDGYEAEVESQTITITEGGNNSVTFRNTLIVGTGSFKKTTNTGDNLAGWIISIYSDESCADEFLVGSITTDEKGEGTLDLVPGIYWAKETGDTEGRWGTEEWRIDSSVKSFEIKPKETSSPDSPWKNDHLGKLDVSKKVETGDATLEWTFGIYSDADCTALVDTVTVKGNETVTSDYLDPGTYYIKEITVRDGWICDETIDSVDVAAGAVTPANHVFENTEMGKLSITKKINTDNTDLLWEFGIFDDETCETKIATLEVKGNETVTSDWLAPGTYYVKEITTREGWICDETVSSVEVVPGEPVPVDHVYENTEMGRFSLLKITNTPDELAGWTFGVFTSKECTGESKIGELTVDNTGVATSDWLPAGTYYVKELHGPDSVKAEYWEMDTSIKSVDVMAGKLITLDGSFVNTEYGDLIIRKTTQYGDPSGWTFHVYDENGVLVDTLTTKEDGTAISKKLLPGTYTIKESHDRSDYYWTYDVESEKTVEVKDSERAEVKFENNEFGRISIQKVIDTDGPMSKELAGWEFRITDANGKEIEGSPFKTDENGQIVTGKLAPGKYTVEEVIPSGSLFAAASENPVVVEVTNGKTSEVSVTNAPLAAEIVIEKVNDEGVHLGSARIRLEWFDEESQTWKDIAYSDSKYPKMGCTNNPNVVGGCLVTDDNGMAVFGNLYPTLQYRITEAQAPAGYIKIRTPIFTGKLPDGELTQTFTVKNHAGFDLPETGETGYNAVISAMAMAGLLLSAGLVLCVTEQKKKKVK